MRHVIVTAAAALAALLAAAPGHAAPQILGLVATSVAQPMTCDDDVCTVELSAFCLQRDRDEPARGAVYDPRDPASIVLNAMRTDGEPVAMPVGAVAEIAAARSSSAVRVTLPRTTVAALGSAPAISVAPMATLVPRAVPGDPDPLTEAEIARAAGPVRGLAAMIEEGGTSDGNAARILSRLINAMPEDGLPDERQQAAMWDHALEAVGGRDDVLGAAPAAQKFANCQYAPSAGMSVKDCLRMQHDDAVGSMNIDIWSVTGAGS